MKKGFTLVELLAVIVILSIILVIAIPNILNVINNSRIEAYKRQEELLIGVAQKYLINNEHILPANIGEITMIDISEFESANLIDGIKNTWDGSNCSGYVVVRKIESASYNYEPFIRCGKNYTTDGLIAWYPFDNNANDYTGNNYNASITGVTFVQDGINRAANFNGASQVTVNNFYNPGHANPALIGTGIHNTQYNGNATYVAWVKPATVDSNYRSVFDDGNYGEGTIRFYDNRIHCQWDNSNSTVYYVTINPNSWYHVAMVHEKDDASNLYLIKLYFNGVLVGSNSLIISNASEWYGPDPYFRIGLNWIGLIDDVKIYDKVLSGNQILSDYNNTKIGK